MVIVAFHAERESISASSPIASRMTLVALHLCPRSASPRRRDWYDDLQLAEEIP